MALWQWLLSQLQLHKWRHGQGLVEYALILVFVAVVLIALLVILGPGIADVYQNIYDTIK